MNASQTLETEASAETMTDRGFLRAIATGRTDFTGVVFTTPILWEDLDRASATYRFDQAVFQHTLEISDARLWGQMSFKSAVFESNLHVYRSRIAQLDCSMAVFKGPVSFGNSSWFFQLILILDSMSCCQQLWIEADVCSVLSLEHTTSPKTYIDWARVPADTNQLLAQLGEVHTLPKAR